MKNFTSNILYLMKIKYFGEFKILEQKSKSFKKKLIFI